MLDPHHIELSIGQLGFLKMQRQLIDLGATLICWHYLNIHFRKESKQINLIIWIIQTTPLKSPKTDKSLQLKLSLIITEKSDNKPWAYICSKGFLLGLFSEGLVIGRNFAFQNGLGLSILVFERHFHFAGK